MNAERLQELREQTERLSEFSVFGSMVQGELSALVDMALAHFHEEYPYDCECFNSGQTQAEEYAKRIGAVEAERLRAALTATNRWIAMTRADNLGVDWVKDIPGSPFKANQKLLRVAGTEANVDRLTEVIEREGWEDTKR